MPPTSQARTFAVVRTALALVEERGAVPLATAAEAAGVGVDELRELLDPVLFLEYRDGRGDIVDLTAAFLLDERGDLVLTEDHWLRSLRSVPPEPDDAFRLLLAGLVHQAASPEEDPALDRALAKLAPVVDAAIGVSLDRPAHVSVALDAWSRGRSLRFRYLPDDATAASDREALPQRVWSRWGRWYLQAIDLGDGVDKQFRVDRIAAAELGDRDYEPPDDVEPPEWFDLSAHERTVRLRIPAERLEALPEPHRRGEPEPAGTDGRVDVDVTVAGEHRLEHLLLVAGPDAEVLDPPEWETRRRDHARRILTDMRR